MISHETTFERDIDDLEVLRAWLLELTVRLLGMGVSGIDASPLTQGLLFDQDERRRQADLDAAIDRAKGRFGTSALRRASSLDRDKRLGG